MFESLLDPNQHDHLLDQVGAMIAHEAIYTPCNESCSPSTSSVIDNSCTSSSSLERSTPPPSPISVLDDSAYDHHPKKRFKSRKGGLSPEIHREVSQWMYRVIDHYSFDRKIVAIGMNFFVRYVSAMLDKHDHDLSFELCTATSLYIAIKLFGGPKATRCDKQLLSNFAQMSNSRFDVKSIVQMEMKMLNTFSWYVNPSTPQDFVPYFVEILVQHQDHKMDNRTKAALIDLSNYILELVVFNNEFSFIKSSSLACAGIAIAQRGLARIDDETSMSLSPQEEFGYLKPFFTNGSLSIATIRKTINSLDSYFIQISPMLDDTDLGVDITGSLFKRSLSRGMSY